MLTKDKSSYPVVFAEIEISNKVPIFLIYGHFDVQPADKLDGWTSKDPFKLKKILDVSIRLVRRGAIYNKSQIFYLNACHF